WKKLIIYSLPLIPNTLMWWLINASSRYFIAYYVGLSANGLFGIASRIPSLLTLVSQVFNQAWQLSVIDEYDNKNNTSFYSKIFVNFSSIMIISISMIILMLKLAFELLFEASYFEAWQVTPFLLLSAVFSSFTGFLGSVYIETK